MQEKKNNAVEKVENIVNNNQMGVENQNLTGVNGVEPYFPLTLQETIW